MAPKLTYVVQVVCKNEDVTVALVETTGSLSAVAIVSGAKDVDPVRWPEKRQVQENQQMYCRLCGGNLWFKTGKGETFAASPGSISIEG